MPQIYLTKRTRQRKNKDGTNAPQPKCESCGKTIEVGMPHRNVSVRSGSFSQVRVRCVDCPSWQPWDLSDALWAQIARVVNDFEQDRDAAEGVDDVTSALSTCAEAIREIAEAKRESAQNIEDGFQHPTYQSDELNEQADSLDSWADEIENADVPEYPEPEEDICETCEGLTTDGDGDCTACSGTGLFTPDEPTEDQIDEWVEAVYDATSIVNESPV